jgi:hypothetical protein
MRAWFPAGGRRPRFAGVPDFGLLHADLAADRQDRLLYYAFDLLYLDGFDLRRARLAGALLRRGRAAVITYGCAVVRGGYGERPHLTCWISS